MSIIATKTRRKPLERQTVEFDDEMSEAELIESLKPKGKPVPFEMLPEELRKGLEAALQEVHEGHFYTNEEVFRELDEWLENN